VYRLSVHCSTRLVPRALVYATQPAHVLPRPQTFNLNLRAGHFAAAKDEVMTYLYMYRHLIYNWVDIS
jgi:hypothetical protein